MAKKIIRSVFLFVILFSVFFLSITHVNAQSCLNTNITLTNSLHLVCTSQWIKIVNPVSLYNATLISKGIIINNTFELKGNSLLNASSIINLGNFTLNSNLSNGYNFVNKGKIFLEHPIFINFTSFLNNGSIYNENYLGNGGNSKGYDYGMGGSFLNSYAGSGGGSIQNNSANDGGSTLAKPGIGYVLCYKNGCDSNSGAILYPPNVSGNKVTASPLNYTFNLSLLNSAGGADFNGNYSGFVNGTSGVFPLIIISKEFANHGLITDEGQPINYSDIPNGKQALENGIVGAGGGGIVEVISKEIIANGTINVSGGRIYISKALNASLDSIYPDVYNLSVLGDGGAGNVFEFKASNSLLLRSLPNYNVTFGNISNSTSTLNNVENDPSYSIKVTLANDYSCSTNGIHVKLISNNSIDNFPLNQSFSLNTASNRAQLQLYGTNPLINYYATKNISLSNKTFYFTAKDNLTVNLGVSSLGFGINITSYSIQLKKLNVSHELMVQLPIGRYNLTVYNKTNSYNYSFYVSPNCLGYENLSFFPKKSYYTYDGLNISNTPFLVNRTQIVKTVSENVYYAPQSCQEQNISQLIALDKQIMTAINSLNNSIGKASQKPNYSLFFNEINKTDPFLYKMNSYTQPNISLNETGFDMYSYSSGGNLTKDKFILSGNQGIINLSYGNESISMYISKQHNANPFAAFESGVIKVIEYVPSTFMGFLGGL